jgi:16S rRNA (guanine966-N2)-methyltransferase
VRIIAGSFRGHPLEAPRGRATRPTSDRVREALFSILGDVSGLEVLDLFAGSGALAFEALSRGAERAVLVEEARGALAALRANIDTLGVGERATVVAARVESALGRLAATGSRFGLVFADPPYAAAAAEGSAVLGALVGQGLLWPGAWIVLEHASRDAAPVPPAGLELRFSRVYGDTALTFYRHVTEAG